MGILDYFGNATVVFFFANALYVISYMLTSMIWLRLLAIVAAASTFPYFYFQTEPLWSALFWQSCFLIVNLINLLVLLYSMRSTQFEGDEATAYELKFSELKPHEVRTLFKYAKTSVLEDGQVLLRDGESNQRLYLILSGETVVMKHGQEVARLKAGDLVGELSFISNDITSAEVHSSGESRLMYWDKTTLEPLFKKQGLYESYFNSLCSLDVASKLRNMTHAQTRTVSV